MIYDLLFLHGWPADPESQRKRTVQNVLDLRQNLEDTMSSLRGSQLSHRWVQVVNFFFIMFIMFHTGASSLITLKSVSNWRMKWYNPQPNPAVEHEKSLWCEQAVDSLLDRCTKAVASKQLCCGCLESCHLVHIWFPSFLKSPSLFHDHDLIWGISLWLL